MAIPFNAPPGDSGIADAPLADGALLSRFVDRGDQEAFAALMKRHGPYLLGVCRRITFNAQDAEDVFQACFLELVRRASSIRERGSVAGWLQAVAVRLARKARVRHARRHEKELAGRGSAATVDPDTLTWSEIRQVLEEELANLPEKFRAPILLCLFQGQTREEAAQYLEITPSLLKYRLGRGRELLQKRLTRRGVSLAALGALLSSTSAEASVPAALLQGTLQVVGAAANKTALTGAVSPGVLGLLESSGVLAGWGVAAWALLVVSLFGAGALAIPWDQIFAPPPPAAAPQAEPQRRRTTVHRSFRGMQFDAGFLKWSGPRKYARPEDEGLRITLPVEKGPALPVGVAVRYPIRGDFEIEATFEFLHVGPSEDGFFVGPSIYLYMPSAHRDGLWFGKMNHPLQGPVFTFGQRVTEGDARRNKNFKHVPAQREAGVVRLRIERQGMVFRLLAAEGDGGDLQLLDSMEISDETVQIVRFAADHVHRPDAAIDVRLVEFTLAAEEFVGYQPN